jgi:benzoyl-CoA 2,3-dioxygenase component B
VLRSSTFKMGTPAGTEEVPMLNALNEVMRESYLKDCEIGLKRWNRQIERAGFPSASPCPPRASAAPSARGRASRSTRRGRCFRRRSTKRSSIPGFPRKPTAPFVHSLMQKVVEPGKMAAWIAPPERGINNLAVGYEYVKLH